MSSAFSFAKLFSSITLSSVWSESSDIRVVWITLLAEADQHGRVMAAIPGLARVANVPISVVEEALRKFLAPDKYSRSKEFDGRRIEEIPGGWRILNYKRYRNLRDEEDRKEYKRNWDRENRTSGRTTTDPTGSDTDPTPIRQDPTASDTNPTGSDNPTPIRQDPTIRPPSDQKPTKAEAEAEAEADADPDSEAEQQSQTGSPPARQAQRHTDLIREEIERHEAFRPLDATKVAANIEGRRMMRGTPIKAVLTAIAECAAKSDGVGLKPHMLLSRLISFTDQSRMPQERSTPATADAGPIESEIDRLNREEAERRRSSTRRQA